ncbi:MAG: patatin-like phospholipase family protein [Thiovulaceae bacterium]|jgi:NTE family protein|nr:patatin-like phospholipase family protein [Sulfurimonadaceae bacterium]MDD3816792.1 patatin-like phospholipase family protein [Sulfurimonadaceae bacterium]
MEHKSVSLVLGSGGARGLVHVGVIKWLEENGYTIESISGCSIGALIGGLYAAGRLDAYVEWLCKSDAMALLKLLDFKGTGGLVSGEKLMRKLHAIAGEHRIEDLPLKFTAVATDINAEKEVWINNGPLLEAIRASISLPLFFTPYTYNAKVLVDGGVLNPVPIAPTFHDETDLTIAVNLGGPISEETLLPKEQEDTNGFVATIKEYLKKFSKETTLVSQESMVMVANKSFETMQGSLAKMKLSVYPPDIEIEVPRNLCGTFEFHKAKELIQYGYDLCQNHPQLHALKKPSR